MDRPPRHPLNHPNTNAPTPPPNPETTTRAVEHELERELLDGYLRELDDKYGHVPEKLIEHYDAVICG